MDSGEVLRVLGRRVRWVVVSFRSSFWGFVGWFGGRSRGRGRGESCGVNLGDSRI